MTDNLPHYHLLTAGTAAELSELVNQYLAEGYEVLGAPFSSPAGTVALLQAVIQYRVAPPLSSSPPALTRSKSGLRQAGALPFYPKNGPAS